MRVVVSLTTIPSRIEYLPKTLVSISNQGYTPDEIYLCIPYTSQREDAEYHIPQEINNYCNIIRCQDYGPITKLIGVLPIETDPDTIIITFDDDVVYPEDTIQKLVSKHRAYPDCAIGSSGYKIGSFPFYYSAVQNQHEHNNHCYSFSVPPDGELVDVLDSTPGILYCRRFFPSENRLDKILRYSVLTDNTIKNDNLVICGYLSKKDVPRRVFKMPRISEIPAVEDGLWSNRSERFFSLLKAYRTVRKEELFEKQVGYSKGKTITYPVIIGFVILIVLGSLMATKKKS